MKILITESQRILLNELAWLETVALHIEFYRIPITQKIQKILYGDLTVNTFHLSDVRNINNIKNIIGRKKTISSFRFMEKSTLREMPGIQTKGGIIYQIKGTLSLYGTGDLGSAPDENGIRWIAPYNIFPEYLKYEWTDLTSKLKTALYIINKDPLKKKQKTELIKKYFLLAHDFVRQHRDEIYNHLLRRYNPLGSRRDGVIGWDEILVSNIQIGDIFWDEGKVIRSYRSKLIDSADGSQQMTQYNDWKNQLVQKLQSLTNGKVYGPESGLTPIEFVEQRGGITSSENYKLPDELLYNREV